MNTTRTLLTTAVVLAALFGCASSPPRVNCDGRLIPINVPMPKVEARPRTPAASPDEGAKRRP